MGMSAEEVGSCSRQPCIQMIFKASMAKFEGFLAHCPLWGIEEPAAARTPKGPPIHQLMSRCLKSSPELQAAEQGPHKAPSQRRCSRKETLPQQSLSRATGSTECANYENVDPRQRVRCAFPVLRHTQNAEDARPSK